MPNPTRISTETTGAAQRRTWVLARLAVGTLMALAALVPLRSAAQTQAAPPPLAMAAVDSKGRVPDVCLAATLASARECALVKCRSGGGQDCRVTAACQPSQWAGSLLVQLPGSQVPLTICGVPSRLGLIARMKDLCRGYRSRGLEACTLDTVWTPEGQSEAPGLRWNRQRLWQGRSVAR